MKRRRIIFVVTGATALLVAAYLVQGYRLRSEVHKLLRQAHGRGMKTELNAIVVPRAESGTTTVMALSGIEAHKELRRLRFEEANIVDARKLIASASNQFEAISDFASLDAYAPRRDLSSGMTVQDYSTLAAALHAESWRGYLLAIDGEFDRAIESTKILNTFVERLQDENLPIGKMVGQRGHLDIRRIILQLAHSNSSNVERIDRHIATAEAIPVHDFRSLVQFELASGLLLIDEVQDGQYDAGRPVNMGPVQFKIARTALALDYARIKVLKTATEAFDTWDTSPVDAVDPGVMGALAVDDDILRHIPQSMQATIDVGRRLERIELANRRAVLLTLEAYKRRAVEGKMPTVLRLDTDGVEATDPWTGDLFTLHEEADGRIWVGAMRPDPKDMPPRKAKLINVFDWRP